MRTDHLPDLRYKKLQTTRIPRRPEGPILKNRRGGETHNVPLQRHASDRGAISRSNKQYTEHGRSGQSLQER